nr:EAL domain-containing protein [Rhizobium sp. CCGE 510]
MRAQHKGLSSEEWANRVHPDERGAHEAMFGQRLQGQGGVLDVDHRMLHADGTYRWFNTHGKVVEWDGEGRPLRMAGMMRDIHQRKTAELGSQESEARFRGIFENTSRLVALLTPEGKNILTNPVGYAFTGLTPEGTSSLHFWEGHWWLNDDDRRKIKEAVLRAATGETVRFEIVQRATNGELLTSDISIAPIFDAEGKVAFLMPEANNITDLKRLQDKLERSERFFRTAFENTSIGFAIYSGDSTLVDANAALCKMLGYERGELIGKTFVDLTPIEDRYHDLETVISQLKAGGGRATLVKRYLRRDGQAILVKSHVVHTDFDPDGTPVQGLCIIEDITEQERMKAALNQSEKLFREAFEFGPVGATILNSDGRYLEVNEAFVRMLGYQRHEIVGLNNRDISVAGDVSADLSAMFQRIEAGGGRATLMKQYIHRDGRAIDARLEVATISGDIRRPTEDLRFLCFAQDMTELRTAQQALQTSELRADLAVTSAGIGVWEWNAQTDLGFYSERTCEILDIGPTEIKTEEAWLALIHPEDRPAYQLSRSAHLEGETAFHKCELRILQKNGTYKWIDDFGKVVERDDSGRPLRMVGTLRDITQTVEQHQKIQKLAFSDPLTALPNRALFNSRCESALNRACIDQAIFALIIIDLDNFKDVNDTLGHLAGDQLLCGVSARLCDCLREADMLARLGGDEFAVILESLPDRRTVADIAERLLASLSPPFRIAGEDLFISASIGVAAYPDQGKTADELFAHADAALYQAKARGRNNFQFYDEALAEKTELKLRLGNALRTACLNNELELAYQPKVKLETGHVIGAEALLRWRHPEFGLLMPASFIPLAEDNGTIVDIGRWVIRNAAQTAAILNKGRQDAIKIAVNLSPRQFIKNDLASHVRDALEETDCHPAWIECEITESLLLENEACVQETLEQLHTLGVSIAIDDFGTGHSALAYLNRFPVDVLKIDRSFISGMDSKSRGKELVTAFILIANALGMEVVAEGVETEEQTAVLKTLGCCTGQGYLYGKPMSLIDFKQSIGSSAIVGTLS